MRVDMPFNTLTYSPYTNRPSLPEYVKNENKRVVEPSTRVEVKLLNLAYNRYGKATVPAPSGQLIDFVVV